MGTSTLDAVDDRRDRAAHVGASFAIIETFYVITAAYLWAQGVFDLPAAVVPSWTRFLINMLTGAVLAGALLVLRAHRSRRLWGALPALVLAAAVAAGVRLGLFVAAGQLPTVHGIVAVETISGFVFCLGAGCLGFAYGAVRRAERLEARAAATADYQRELALRTLETEEVRVRRSIAEGLHGSLQQRLVIAAVQVDMFVEEARRRGFGDEVIDALLALRRDLDDIRENDVRATSRILYPEGIEIGVVPAVRMLLRRLPAGIATRLHVGEALRRRDDPGNSEVRPADRLLVVRIVEEAVTNGLRHGHATSFDVRLDLEDESTIVVDVANNGGAFDVSRATHGSGTRRLRERVELAGGTLDVGSDVEASRIASGEIDGTSMHHAHLRARIPVTRETITGLGHLPSDG